MKTRLWSQPMLWSQPRGVHLRRRWCCGRSREDMKGRKKTRGAAAIAAQAVVAAPYRPKIKWRGDGLFWGRRVYHSRGYIYHTLGLILEANSTGKSTRIKEELKRFQDKELIVLSSSSSFYILVIIMDCFDGYVRYFYNMLG